MGNSDFTWFSWFAYGSLGFPAAGVVFTLGVVAGILLLAAGSKRENQHGKKDGEKAGSFHKRAEKMDRQLGAVNLKSRVF